MTHSTARLRALLAPLLACAGCTFHNTATHWNGRVGTSGKPVFVKSSTNVGVNLGIVLPLLGRTSMNEMVDSTSAAIAEAGGDRLRVIETGAENYWYGFPPITWILTPVITDIAIEYEPTPEEVTRILTEEQQRYERARQRWEEESHDHVIPQRKP